MSGEYCQVSSLNGKCSESSAEVESGRAGESAEDTEELREYKNFRIGREERASINRLEECSDDIEATVTTNFLGAGAKITIAPKAMRDLNSKQSSVRNQAQIDNDAEEREDIANGDKGRSKRGSTFNRQMIYIADCIFASVIVGPMVVSHWRGIWVLMDFHENIFTGWVSFAVGISLHLLFALLRQPLHEAFASSIKPRGPCFRLGCRLIRTLYTYVFSIACNCHWRGAWILLNDWFGVQAGVIVLCTCAILSDLLVLRWLRNLLAPPFLVTVDCPSFVFRFPTMYRTNSKDWSLYILDCAFSVGIVGTLVVFVWRGAWVLFDLYLYSENRERSAVGSLVIGYVIVVVSFTLQPLMRYTCSRLTGLARLVAADGFLLLSFIGTVNVWRGVWNVLDLWLLPEDPKLSCWITHLGCFAFLVLLNCSNSVLVRGVYIDAEEEAGKCVVFPCHYLRLFFKIEREKKEARRRNLIVASRDLGTRGDPSSKEAENGALLNTSVSPIIQSANPEALV